MVTLRFLDGLDGELTRSTGFGALSSESDVILGSGVPSALRLLEAFDEGAGADFGLPVGDSFFGEAACFSKKDLRLPLRSATGFTNYYSFVIG